MDSVEEEPSFLAVSLWWLVPSYRPARRTVSTTQTCHTWSAQRFTHMSVVMFVISRFILGLGIPLAIVGATSLIGGKLWTSWLNSLWCLTISWQELSYPKERAILGSLFNSCYFIGSIVAAGITLGTFSMKSNWGWRIPSLLQIFPSLSQIIFIYFLPESPRWLISKGRDNEALAILGKYHAEGDMDSEFVKAEYVQIKQTLELEKETSKVGWMDMFSQSGMRKRLLVASFLGLVTQWSGNGLVSYVLIFWLGQCWRKVSRYFLARILDNVGIHDNRTKNLINLANTCWGFVNATALALTVPRFKRRTIYLVSKVPILNFSLESFQLLYSFVPVPSLLSLLGGPYAAHGMRSQRTKLLPVLLLRKQGFFVHSNVYWPTVKSFIFLYSPAYNIAYNALTYSESIVYKGIRHSDPLTSTAFLVELFPFHVRAKGITVFQWFGRAAGFFNQFVNPIGIANAGWKYYIRSVLNIETRRF